MREIKFRAWDGKEMINPYCELKENNHFWGEDLVNTPFNSPVAVMQYCGLKDKDGKEIYEGDRLKDHGGYVWIVFWYDEHACFGVKSAENSVASEIIDNGNMEVIGNIYETPELLKQ